MKVKQFVDTLKKIATEYDTLYVYGCIGSLLTLKNYTRYTERYDYNQKASLRENYKKAIEKGDVFGFDCVCLIKSVLWGWSGNKDHVYGGAVYKSNDVPDTNVNGIFKLCTDKSDDFSNIEIGEYLYMDGHCGVYVGGGLAVECTPKWDNKVQITAVGNIGMIDGYNTRVWEQHGKLPWVDYSAEVEEVPEPEPMPEPTPETEKDIEVDITEEEKPIETEPSETPENFPDLPFLTPDYITEITPIEENENTAETKKSGFSEVLTFVVKIVEKALRFILKVISKKK